MKFAIQKHEEEIIHSPTTQTVLHMYTSMFFVRNIHIIKKAIAEQEQASLHFEEDFFSISFGSRCSNATNTLWASTEGSPGKNRLICTCFSRWIDKA